MYRLQLNVRLQQKHMEHEAFSLDEDTVRAMKILGFPDIGEDRLTVSELLWEQTTCLQSKQPANAGTKIIIFPEHSPAFANMKRDSLGI